MKKVLSLLVIALSLVSCKKEHNDDDATNPVKFYNVLILGNSITYSAANPSIGWNGSWGMAATTPDKDYVHLLAAKFKQSNPAATVQAVNISAFELNCETYDFDTELKAYKNSNPDLLILRIGENVQSNFDTVTFANRYQSLITYMKTGNPNLKILAAGSFWPNRDYVNVIMSRYTPYVSLAALGSNTSNYAFDMLNVTDAVKGHPGDKGMQAIYDMIWAAITKLN